MISGIDTPSTGIVGRRDRWSDHGSDSSWLKNIRLCAEAIYFHHETREIGSAGNPTAMRIGTGNIIEIRVLPTLSVIDHFTWFTIGQCATPDLHSSNARGSKHFIFDELLVGFT